MAVDWRKVWAEFEEEYNDSIQKTECDCCHRRETVEPDWNDQQKIIERVVNKQLKSKRKVK